MKTNSRSKLSRPYSCEEVYERMDKGLCLFCEELDSPGHYQLKHKGSQILMIEVNEEQPFEDNELVKPTVETDLSLHQVVKPLESVTVSLDCVDLTQKEDHTEVFAEEKLNQPLGQSIEHLVCDETQNTLGSVFVSEFEPPPLLPKPPDPPDFNQSDSLSAIKAAPSNLTSKTSTSKLRRTYSCEEIYERMENGLCVFCEEKDIPGHYHLEHKNSQIFMIDCDDNPYSDYGHGFMQDAIPFEADAVNLGFGSEEKPVRDGKQIFEAYVVLATQVLDNFDGLSVQETGSNEVEFHVYRGSPTWYIMISLPQWTFEIGKANLFDCEGRSFECLNWSTDKELVLHGLPDFLLAKHVWEPGGISVSDGVIKIGIQISKSHSYPLVNPTLESNTLLLVSGHLAMHEFLSVKEISVVSPKGTSVTGFSCLRYMIFRIRTARKDLPLLTKKESEMPEVLVVGHGEWWITLVLAVFSRYSGFDWLLRFISNEAVKESKPARIHEHFKRDNDRGGRENLQVWRKETIVSSDTTHMVRSCSLHAKCCREMKRKIQTVLNTRQTKLCKRFKEKYLELEDHVRRVVPLLLSAIHKVHVSTKSLSALHPDCLQICLQAKGMICNGLKRFHKALELLYNVVTAPPLHLVNGMALERTKVMHATHAVSDFVMLGLLRSDWWTLNEVVISGYIMHWRVPFLLQGLLQASFPHNDRRQWLLQILKHHVHDRSKKQKLIKAWHFKYSQPAIMNSVEQGCIEFSGCLTHLKKQPAAMEGLSQEILEQLKKIIAGVQCLKHISLQLVEVLTLTSLEYLFGTEQYVTSGLVKDDNWQAVYDWFMSLQEFQAVSNCEEVDLVIKGEDDVPLVFTDNLTPIKDDNTAEPDATLDRKMLQHHNISITKFPAQWKEHPPDQATWTFYKDCIEVQKFFILEDKDVLKKGVV